MANPYEIAIHLSMTNAVSPALAIGPSQAAKLLGALAEKILTL